MFLGIGYTFNSLTLYTGLNYLIKEKNFGTAFGILQSFQNLGLTVGPLAIGGILGPNRPTAGMGDYTWVHIFLATILGIGMVLIFIVNIYDKYGRNVVNAVRKFQGTAFSTDSSEEKRFRKYFPP